MRTSRFSLKDTSFKVKDVIIKVNFKVKSSLLPRPTRALGFPYRSTNNNINPRCLLKLSPAPTVLPAWTAYFRPRSSKTWPSRIIASWTVVWGRLQGVWWYSRWYAGNIRTRFQWWRPQRSPLLCQRTPRIATLQPRTALKLSIGGFYKSFILFAFKIYQSPVQQAFSPVQ